jgi:surface antigen
MALAKWRFVARLASSTACALPLESALWHPALKKKSTLRGEARDMRVAPALAAIALAWAAAPALADGLDDASEAQPYLQCVAYAREVSGIQIYGDALTWWDQAEGRYQRGHEPRVGAVMAFEPYGSMTRGHVATVSRVIDSRTVLLRHANWSPIDGRRGQIEDDVRAIDVSPGNDWSEVRVWYAPIHDLGTTAWPVAGFIYPGRDARPAFQIAEAEPPKPIAPSRAFLKAFASFEGRASVPLVAKEKRGNGKPIDLIAQIASR